MIDVHSHTIFSFDGKDSPEAMVERAIELGCRVLGFSEHLDYDYVVKGMEVSLTDIGAYFQKAKALKERYGGRINLIFGLECGYAQGAQGYYKEIFKKYQPDYCINSVHVLGNVDLYFEKAFEGRTKENAYGEYLKLVTESLDVSYDYHIVGHIGYASRNAPYSDRNLRYSEFSAPLDELLKKIISLEKAIEINTNIKREGETLPPFEIAKRYFELGGRLITFGSDAHSAGRILDGYEYVIQNLKKTGFTELCYFEKGNLRLYKI